MPSIEELLKNTMFMEAIKADPSGLEPLGPAGPFDAKAPPVPQSVIDKSKDPSFDASNIPIWSWKHDPATLNKITDIECLVHSVGFKQQRVCNDIEFSDIELTHRGKKLTLELNQKFLLERRFIEKGTIDGANPLWPLPEKVDRSLLMIFAYERTGEDKIEPPNVPLNADNFFPSGTPKVSVPDGEGHATVVRNLRILVAIELVCCKEANDFEPFGIMGAGRLNPHTMVTASEPVSEIKFELSLRRPRASAHHHHHHHHDDGETHMASELSIGYYTDTNQNRDLGAILGLPVPVWERIFDYVRHDETTSPKVVVDPSRGARRTMSDALDVPHDPGLIPSPIPVVTFDSRDQEDLEKVPRQGAYDNIHIAPKMRIPGRSTFESNMAPICAHDCLHTHWRWGEVFKVLSGGRHINGWDNAMHPYTVSGAPQVPHNQTITTALISDTSNKGFHYRVAVNGSDRAAMAPGIWQIGFHHGCAYALTLDSRFIKQVRAILSILVTAGKVLTPPFIPPVVPIPLPDPDALTLDDVPPAAFAILYGYFSLDLGDIIVDELGQFLRIDPAEDAPDQRLLPAAGKTLTDLEVF